MGTTWVRALATPAAAHTLMIAQVTPAEIVSGVARHRRDGSIPPRTAHVIRLLIDRHTRREYTVSGLQILVLHHAEPSTPSQPCVAASTVSGSITIKWT
jgi:hypothetical protein